MSALDVPLRAKFNIEHGCVVDSEDIEFQIKIITPLSNNQQGCPTQQSLALRTACYSLNITNIFLMNRISTPVYLLPHYLSEAIPLLRARRYGSFIPTGAGLV